MHDLRHSKGTVMANEGEDLVVIQRTLGHAKSSITADLYVGKVPKALPERRRPLGRPARRRADGRWSALTGPHRELLLTRLLTRAGKGPASLSGRRGDWCRRGDSNPHEVTLYALDRRVCHSATSACAVLYRSWTWRCADSMGALHGARTIMSAAPASRPTWPRAAHSRQRRYRPILVVILVPPSGPDDHEVGDPQGGGDHQHFIPAPSCKSRVSTGAGSVNIRWGRRCQSPGIAIVTDATLVFQLEQVGLHVSRRMVPWARHDPDVDPINHRGSLVRRREGIEHLALALRPVGNVVGGLRGGRLHLIGPWPG